MSVDLSARKAAPGGPVPPANPAVLADLPGLARLVADVMPGGWGAAELAAELTRPDARVFVLRSPPEQSDRLGQSEQTGQSDRSADLADPWGGAIARSSGVEIELLWIGVAPAARRRGVGSRLLDGVLEWGRDSGARVVLEVRASNTAASELYEGAGFVVVGRRPRYYGDGEDAVLLARDPPSEGPP